jgi:hypothetical protein
MKRWVGLGVISDNLINIGRHEREIVKLKTRPASRTTLREIPPVSPAGFSSFQNAFQNASIPERRILRRKVTSGPEVSAAHVNRAIA